MIYVWKQRHWQEDEEEKGKTTEGLCKFSVMQVVVVWNFNKLRKLDFFRCVKTFQVSSKKLLLGWDLIKTAGGESQLFIWGIYWGCEGASEGCWSTVDQVCHHISQGVEKDRKKGRRTLDGVVHPKHKTQTQPKQHSVCCAVLWAVLGALHRRNQTAAPQKLGTL